MDNGRIRTCDYCGAHNYKSFSFCTNCGQALPERIRVIDGDPHDPDVIKIQKERRVRACVNCGAHNPVFARFCVQCGHRLPFGTTGVTDWVYAEYAGFWRRFVAYLIDGIILNIIDFIIGLIAGIIFIIGSDTAFYAIYYGIGSFVGLVYFVGFWSRKSRTPGKMALGVKIVDGEGQPIKLGRSVLRYFGYFVSSVPLGLGFLWIVWDGRKQGWHDKIAGTYVIKI